MSEPQVAPTAAEALRTARARMGWTLQQLADLMGVSAQAVHQWENGDTRPALDNLTVLLASEHADLRRAGRAFLAPRPTVPAQTAQE